ncbi:MAG: efflux RND transporter periplasmic adaptor subunit [Planctomycetaceae bacterium]
MSLARTILGWLAPVAILAAGIAAFVLLGRQPPPERMQPAAQAAIPVTTAAVEPVTDGLEIEADGVVVPLREVTLAAEVGGRVLRKADVCNEGRFVRAGTPLFDIDPRDYEFDVARLERELAQTGIAIAEADEEIAQNATSVGLARRQAELARREAARLEGLKAGKVVTESEHDRAIRDELTAANALSTLEGQRRVLDQRRNRLVEAKALAATLLEKAKLDLARTRIVAPIDGIIVEDKVEQDSFVAKGTPLVTIEDTSAAEVRASLEMDDVARIWGARRAEGAAPGQAGREPLDAPVTVAYSIGDAVYQWRGVLSRQEGRGLDEKTRTLPCRVLVRDPQGVQAVDRYGVVLPQLPATAPRSLLRGMFVEVRVHVDPAEPLVSIPEDAVRPSGEVWVLRDDRLVVLRPRVEQASAGRVFFEAATSGLLAGDRVITSPIAHPRDGMAVTERAARPVRSAATGEREDAT